MNCNKCAKEIRKTYGAAGECSPCYLKRLTLSSRGVLEIKNLKSKIKSLKGELSSMKGKLNTAFRKNEILQSEIDEWKSNFNFANTSIIRMRNGESVWG